MKTLSNFINIKPVYQGIRYSEEYYRDLNRFSNDFTKYFPSFPDDVIRQWPYEHFSDFASENRWDIEYDRLSFRKGRPTNDDIKAIQSETDDNEGILQIGMIHLNDDTFLTNYIKENLTYPEPIIVLDTTSSNITGEYKFKSPLHLLEGHRRTWLLRAIIEMNNPRIPNSHDAWIVTRQ